ncbi:MAG: hypothetical protein ACP5GH_06830 [Nitrososphaeria archaeon]
MSAEVLFWEKRSWYESRSVPLFGFFVSPRQIFFALTFGLLGLLVQAFIPMYYARLAAVVFLSSAGWAIGSQRSPVIPWELAMLAELLSGAGGSGRSGPEPPRTAVPEVHEIPASVPLAVTGRIRTEGPVDVVLLVDGTERARTTVTASSPSFRLYYLPGEDERGAHEIAVVAGGQELRRIAVEVV